MREVSGKLAAAIIVGVVLLIGLAAWKYLSPSKAEDKAGPSLDSLKQGMFGSQSSGK